MAAARPDLGPVGGRYIVSGSPWSNAQRARRIALESNFGASARGHVISPPGWPWSCHRKKTVDCHEPPAPLRPLLALEPQPRLHLLPTTSTSFHANIVRRVSTRLRIWRSAWRCEARLKSPMSANLALLPSESYLYLPGGGCSTTRFAAIIDRELHAK